MRIECIVRSASPADFERLIAIADACAEAPRWTDSVWRDLLAGAGEIVRVGFVAEVDGESAGFIVVSFAADVAEIESVAVLPAFRRKGIGRALCEEALRWARGAGAMAVELEVRASSAVALELYAAAGFVEHGRRREYYRDPVEDAVLMAATL